MLIKTGISECAKTCNFEIKTRIYAVAETARVTITSVIAVDRLTLTVTLNMTYVKESKGSYSQSVS